MTVRTKWHKMMNAVREDRVGVCAPSTSPLALTDGDAHVSRFGVSHRDVYEWILNVNDAPCFVFDEELVEMSRSDSFTLSIRDMARAGVLRLPFPTMRVEFPQGDKTHVVVLYDLSQADDSLLRVLRRHDLDPKDFGQFLAFGYVYLPPSPTSADAVAVYPRGVTISVSTDGSDQPMVGSKMITIGMFENSPLLQSVASMQHRAIVSQAWTAIACGVLIMATEGVVQESVTAGNLNRRRAASGKTPIPDHVYVKIGRVYRSARGTDSDEYVPRRSPRPHWRRGHLRTVRHGSGRSMSRVVFIRPRLVAMPHDAAIDAPTYVVAP